MEQGCNYERKDVNVTGTCGWTAAAGDKDDISCERLYSYYNFITLYLHCVINVKICRQ